MRITHINTHTYIHTQRKPKPSLLDAGGAYKYMHTYIPQDAKNQVKQSLLEPAKHTSMYTYMHTCIP
jgi:hypothetical protein